MDTNRLFIHAYLWNTFGKFLVRGMGIISTLILVRILDPEDFGIMALAMMVSGFFIVVSDLGVNRYIILLDAPSKEDYDSAWTFNILLRLLVLSLIFFTSSYIAIYLENEDLTFVLNVVALTNFFSVLQSVKLIQFERELKFAVINKIQIATKVIAVSVTIGAAFYYKSYYALIIGTAVNVLITVVLSYAYTQYKPTINFTFKKEMFTFSFLLMLRNVVGYCRSQIDTLIVGKLFGGAALGGFNVARQFAILPQTEIIGPAMQPAFSLMSTLKNQPEKFKQKIYQSLLIIYSFIFPCGIGLFLLAEPFVYLVLGDKWSSTASYIGFLGFLMFPFATQMILHNVYDAFNKTKYSMFTDLYGLLLIILALKLLVFPSIEDFVIVRVCIGISSVFFSMILVKLITGLELIKLLKITLYPFIMSFIMAAIMDKWYIPSDQAIFELSLNAFWGAIIYIFFYVIFFKLFLIVFSDSWFVNLLPQKALNILRFKFSL